MLLDREDVPGCGGKDLSKKVRSDVSGDWRHRKTLSNDDLYQFYRIAKTEIRGRSDECMREAEYRYQLSETT